MAAHAGGGLTYVLLVKPVTGKVQGRNIGAIALANFNIHALHQILAETFHAAVAREGIPLQLLGRAEDLRRIEMALKVKLFGSDPHTPRRAGTHLPLDGALVPLGLFPPSTMATRGLRGVPQAVRPVRAQVPLRTIVRTRPPVGVFPRTDPHVGTKTRTLVHGVGAQLAALLSAGVTGSLGT